MDAISRRSRFLPNNRLWFLSHGHLKQASSPEWAGTQWQGTLLTVVYTLCEPVALPGSHEWGVGPPLRLTVSFFNSHLANFTENNHLYALCFLQPSSQQRENGQAHGAAYACKDPGLEQQQPHQAGFTSLIPDLLPGWDLCVEAITDGISASQLHVKVGHCPRASISRRKC